MNIKKTLTSFLAVITLFSNVTPAFSYANNTKINNKNIVEKSSDDTINKLNIEEPIELNSADEIENPPLPKIYNYKWKYSVPLKDASSKEEYTLSYQPYEASVGENATDEEKEKINKKINLPDLTGYERPKGVDSYDITYDNIVKNSTTQHENLFFGEKNFKYTPKEITVKVRYKFQTLEDRNKYEDAKDLKDKGGLVKEYKVKTGEKYKIPKLSEEDEKKYAQGFVAEQNELFVTIPTTPNVEFIFHYNRNSFQLDFHSNGGSYVPNMTLYYGQTIPNLFEKPAPTKEGATFDGWRLNQDITIKDGNTEKKLSKGTIIKEDEYPDGLKNAMPFENISLSAVWKEKEKSSYAIQFWTQKAESDGYDYVGFKEVKDVKTGTIPDLDKMMPDGIKFPEISEDLTKEDRQEELKKYYVRNVEKTKKENLILTDDTNGKKEYKIKRVDSTGNTTYNIYYDRQTYTILFEKSNRSGDKPEIKMDIPNVGKFDSEKSVNKPYKITAKFGERLKGWPHDEWLLVNSENGDMDENSDEYKEQLKTKTEFPIGEFMLGWTFNTDPAQVFYRDTPPYWMTSKDFIDPYLSYTDDKKKQQLAKKVTNSVSTGEKLPERTISVGPDSNSQGKVYYVEFSMQGLPKDENDTSVPKLKFNPALAYWKTDTSSSDYKYTIPEIPGFKKQEDKVYPEGSYDFDDLKDKINDEFNERNPDERPLFNYAPKNINGNEIENSGYIVAKYDREKYKLTLNTDPRDKNKTEEYGDVYYDMPLRKLHLDDKKIPAKPNDLPSNYVFKGWATDPKGFNLIKDENKKANEIEEEIKEAYKNIPDEYIENDDGTEENDDPNLKKESNAKKYKFKANIEKLNSKLDGAEHRMPNYNLTVYAIWGAPDKVFDISFDLNDDNNSPAEWQINPEDLASYADGEKIQTSIGYKPYYKPEFDAKRSTNNKKIFTINNALSIKTPQNIPKRKGHDFLGWELLTDNQTEDEGYRKKYGVPRLYSFGNEVISNIHLRAIWNKNSLEDVKVTHHLLSEDYKKDEQKETILENQRSNVNATAYGQMQGEEHILLEEEEFQSLDKDNRAKKLYEEYKQKTNQKNSYYQNLTVKKHDEAKEENFDNHFHFFYRPYRYRTYNVNYILLPNDYDKDKLNKTSNPYYQNKILTAKIKNGNRHFDAIDYEKIPGYKLVSDPQVQLFFEVDENSHKLIGMNGHNEAGFDQVNFYYKDMRIIKRKSANDKTPNGYHRVTFKANEGGNFGNDEKGKEIKEISYDVINGLHFDKINLPAPQGEDNYIFNKWENEALLKGKDEISKDYTFNATFKKVDDVIEVTDNSNQDIPKNYVDVFVDTGDKASENTRFKKHFKVTPKSSVTIPVNSPTGGSIKDATGKVYQYNFTAWVQANEDGSDIAKPLKWTENNPITATFTSTTYIKAKYNVAPATVADRYIVNDGSSPKPDGFVEVSFNKGEHGNISGKSSYFVNPKMKVKLKELVHPTVKADDGYTFTGWSKDDDFVITSDTSIVANYISNVFDVTDNSTQDIPKNYVDVFVDTGDKASENTRFKKHFKVNPKSSVKIPVSLPTGDSIKDANGKVYQYNFTAWVQANEDGSDIANPLKWTENNPITATFTSTTYIKAKYNVAPATVADRYIVNDGSSVKPDGFVEVSFDKGEHGNISGKSSYFVNPKMKVKLKELVHPNVKADDGYTFTGWNKDDDFVITSDISIVANYISNVFDVTDNPTQDIPKNYVDVFVDTGDKASKDTKFKKHFKVTPKSSVTINVDSPAGDSFTDKDGKLYQYNFTAWVQANEDGSDIANPLKWDKNNPITATFTSTTYIKAKYNFTAAKVDGRYIVNDGSSPKPDGFVEVSFDKGEHGNISGTQSYFVNPKMKVKLKELVHPTVKADDGYTFDGWSKDDDFVIDSYLYVIAKYKVNKPNNNNNNNSNNNGNNHTPDAIRPDSNIPAPEEEDNNNEPDNNAKEDNTANSISKVDNKKIMKKENIKRLVNTGIKTSKNHYLLALLIAIIGIIFVKRKNK